MAYGLQLLTPPGGEPLTRAEAKLYLRVDPDITIDDPLIDSLIIGARQYIESWLGAALVSQKWKLTLDRFPSLWWIGSWGNSYQDYQGYQGPSQGAGQGNWQWTLDGKTIRIPKPPLQAVPALQFNDTDGALKSMASTSVAADISTGIQTVTPASMAGISTAGNVGGTLLIDGGTSVQEIVTVTSITATTFTATFVNAHTGPVSVVGFQTMTTKRPGLISPLYGQAWPIARAQYESVQISFICGFGPVTSSAASVIAASQTVTPASMFGIYAGTILTIEPGTVNQETVTVSSVTATTFVATFSKAHTGPFNIGPAMPESIKNALRLLIGHWYEERKPVAIGSTSKQLEYAVDSILSSEWSGEYIGA